MVHPTEQNPYLPKLMEAPFGPAPRAPSNVAATGVDRLILLDLAIKMAQMVPHFTLEWASKKLLLPQGVIAELMEELRSDMLLEVRGQDPQGGGYSYAISQRGREQADRMRQISGYVGPAPVSLDSYTAMLEWQSANFPQVTSVQVEEVLSQLVLTEDVTEISSLAISSGRSIFLSGPPGNGKTSLGRALHKVQQGDLWVPHCIAVENSIIRLYDPHCHVAIDSEDLKNPSIDQRWVRVHRPLIVVGGEMTLESLDLAYHEGLRFYEAPLHMKANGGTYLIDDFGRQRVEPEELLNRWIIPLEHGIDFLTLHSGQKIEVPFMLMLIIATNLDPKDVTDPAFLRRIGYRLRLLPPTPEGYADIFRGYAGKYNVSVDENVLSALLAHYKQSGRELRSCEPRDLIERVRDICKLRGQELEISDELLGLAWKGYFGEELSENQSPL